MDLELLCRGFLGLSVKTLKGVYYYWDYKIAALYLEFLFCFLTIFIRFFKFLFFVQEKLIILLF